MSLAKEEVICQLCGLASRVGEVKFRHAIPHDCFCDESNPDDNYFQFDEEVLGYIVDSVNMRLRGDYESS